MSAADSDNWHRVGNHAVRFEPPDIIHTRPNGDISLSDSLALSAFAKSLSKPVKGYFSLIDMAHAGRQDPAVTKHPEAHEYLASQRAQVFYNASFHQRALIGIFVRLSRLLKHSKPANAVIFATEAEARAWIDETRKNDG